MKFSAPLLVASAVVAATLLFFSGCATAPQSSKATKVQPRVPVTESTLFYGGFTYASADEKIAERYPCTALAETMMNGGLDQVCLDYFSALPGETQADGFKTIALNPHTKLRMTLGKPKDVPLAFAVGLTQEVVLRETLQAQGVVKMPYKVIVTLYFNLLVLDFNEMEVVSAVPFHVTLQDLGERPFTDEKIASLIKEMFTTAGEKGFAGQLKLNLPQVYGRGKNMRRMQVQSVALGDHVSKYMPDDLRRGATPGASNDYNEQIGNELTEIFGSVNNVAMLPFSKDGQTAHMALRFSRDKLDFRIPEPSYTLRFGLDGINKSVAEQNALRTIWGYTAQGTASIGIPQSRSEGEPSSDTVLYTGKSTASIKKYQANTLLEADVYPTIVKLFEALFKNIAEDANKNTAARENVLDQCRL